MKKAISILLALCLACCLCVPAFAADAQTESAPIEEAAEYYLDDSFSEVLYIRFGAQVRGVSPALTTEFLPGSLDPEYVPDENHIKDMRWILPCEENGDRLELFLKADAFLFDLHLTGLTDAQGNALECTVIQDQIATRPLYFWVDTDEMTNILLGFYAGEHTIKSILWDRDIMPQTTFCLVGETVYLPEGLSPALQNRAKLMCDGVELQENDDGTYTAVSGTGTVTYDVAGQFSVTAKLCIQTPEERRVFAAREAAKRPLVTSYLWMLSAAVLPVLHLEYAGLAVLPASLLLALATLPLGYLVQILALRFWL